MNEEPVEDRKSYLKAKLGIDLPPDRNRMNDLDQGTEIENGSMISDLEKESNTDSVLNMENEQYIKEAIAELDSDMERMRKSIGDYRAYLSKLKGKKVLK